MTTPSPTPSPRAMPTSLHSYHTTKQLLRSIGGLESPRFWRSKFDGEFSARPYFAEWTAEENFLVQTKGIFALIVDLNPYEEGEFVHPELFQY
jgi:hypothetical protein